jgi:hypothetical protein
MIFDPRISSVEIVSSARTRNIVHQRYIRSMQNEIREHLEANHFWLNALEGNENNEVIFLTEHCYSLCPTSNHRPPNGSNEIGSEVNGD